MGNRWLQPRYVEGGVDSAHCGGEPQSDGRGADDTGDGKWPHVPGCKLTCAASDGDVLGRETHALSNPVGGSRSPPSVSLLLHSLHRPDQVVACGPPCALAPPDEGRCRRDSHLHLLAREQRGLVTEAALKGRQLRGRRGMPVDGILSPGQLSTPGGQLLAHRHRSTVSKH